MKNRTPAKNGSILHLDMPRQEAIVGDHDPVSHHGIMAHVHPYHQEVVVPHLGCPFLPCGTVDSDIFPDDIVIPDLHVTSGVRLEGEILGIRAQDGTVSHGISLTHPDMTRDHGPGLNPATCSDHCPSPDQNSGPHLDIRGQLGGGINEGGGMDDGHSANYEG